MQLRNNRCLTGLILDKACAMEVGLSNIEADSMITSKSACAFTCAAARGSNAQADRVRLKNKNRVCRITPRSGTLAFFNVCNGSLGPP